MKRASKLLLLISLVFLGFSCKKDKASDTNSDSYVKIKKNGTWITYAGLGELGPDLGDNTKTDIGISGTSADMKEVFNISIQKDGADLPVGIYSSDVYTPYYVIVSLMVSNSSTMNEYHVDDASGREPSKYTVNITSITSGEIKGTFTGNYLYDEFSSDSPDKGIVQVTEGEFKVKRIR